MKHGPLASLFAVTLLLGGCVTTTDTAEIEARLLSKTAVCKAWLPVSWSLKDTDQTILEAKQNNASRKVFCE